MMFSVRRSLAWMAVSQGGLFIIQFGTSLVIARLLTPYEMGVFAIAVAIWVNGPGVPFTYVARSIR